MANKRIKQERLYVGQLVVCSEHIEAQVRTVSALLDNFIVEVQWYEGDKLCAQGVDYSLLREPTLKQIECSIAHNGPLVPMNGIALLA